MANSLQLWKHAFHASSIRYQCCKEEHFFSSQFLSRSGPEQPTRIGVLVSIPEGSDLSLQTFNRYCQEFGFHSAADRQQSRIDWSDMAVAIRLELGGHLNQAMGQAPEMQRTTEVNAQKNTDSVVRLMTRNAAVDNAVAIGGTTIAFDMLTDRRTQLIASQTVTDFVYDLTAHQSLLSAAIGFILSMNPTAKACS